MLAAEEVVPELVGDREALCHRWLIDVDLDAPIDQPGSQRSQPRALLDGEAELAADGVHDHRRMVKAVLACHLTSALARMSRMRTHIDFRPDQLGGEVVVDAHLLGVGAALFARRADGQR